MSIDSPISRQSRASATAANVPLSESRRAPLVPRCAETKPLQQQQRTPAAVPPSPVYRAAIYRSASPSKATREFFCNVCVFTTLYQCNLPRPSPPSPPSPTVKQIKEIMSFILHFHVQPVLMMINLTFPVQVIIVHTIQILVLLQLYPKQRAENLVHRSNILGLNGQMQKALHHLYVPNMKQLWHLQQRVLKLTLHHHRRRRH